MSKEIDIKINENEARELSLRQLGSFMKTLYVFELGKGEIINYVDEMVQEGRKGEGNHIVHSLHSQEITRYDPYEMCYFYKLRKSDVYQAWHVLSYASEDLDSILTHITFHDALPFYEDHVKTLQEKNVNPSGFLLHAIDTFVKTKISPEVIKDFLNSNVERFSDPNLLLKTMNKKFDAPGVINALIEKYRDKIDLRIHPICGEESIFRSFDDKVIEEHRAVDKVSQKLEYDLDEKIQEGSRTQRDIYGAYEYCGLSWEDIDPSLDFIQKVVGLHYIPSNHEALLKKLSQGMNLYKSNYSERPIRLNKDRLASVELQIMHMSESYPQELEGKGLEVIDTEIGNKIAFLDGECIGGVANSEFGEHATNGDVVAWVVREQIDQDYWRGSQRRDRVLAWRKGRKIQQEIYEDNAWAKERYFYVSPPKVTSEGDVEIVVTTDNKKEVKKVKIDK